MSELDDLIKEQSEELRLEESRYLRWRKRKRAKVIPATDLGLGDLDSLPTIERQSQWVREDSTGKTAWMVGDYPWEAWQHGEATALLAKIEAASERGETIPDPTVCPVCESRKLRSFECCLGCNRHGKDGRAKWRGAPVEVPTRKSYKPGKLKGGMA